jgi:hypothetical protein
MVQWCKKDWLRQSTRLVTAIHQIGYGNLPDWLRLAAFRCANEIDDQHDIGDEGAEFR